MTTVQTEVAVIGGGVIGNAIAYSLARQGSQTLVIERAGIASEPAASWASAGGVRRQGRHPAEARLAIEAIKRWKTLEQELGADLHYRQAGQLLLAENDTDAEALVAFVQRQQALGFTDVRLVDRQEVQARASHAMRRHETPVVAAARLFDFDYIRAEICQHLACIRARNKTREVKDAYAIKGLSHKHWLSWL